MVRSVRGHNEADPSPVMREGRPFPRISKLFEEVITSYLFLRGEPGGSHRSECPSAQPTSEQLLWAGAPLRFHTHDTR